VASSTRETDLAPGERIDELVWRGDWTGFRRYLDNFTPTASPRFLEWVEEIGARGTASSRNLIRYHYAAAQFGAANYRWLLDCTHQVEERTKGFHDEPRDLSDDMPDDRRNELARRLASNVRAGLRRPFEKVADLHDAMRTLDQEDRTATSPRPRMSKQEANVIAREILVSNPKIAARALAEEIGCSLGLVPKLPAWRAVQEKLAEGRKPRERSTDPRVLEELIDEQRADAGADERRRRRTRRTA